jgi:hypothetical protein
MQFRRLVGVVLALVLLSVTVAGSAHHASLSSPALVAEDPKPGSGG